MDEIDLFIQQNPSFMGLSRDVIQGILNQRGGNVQQPINAAPNAFDTNSGNLFPQNPQQNIPASPVVNGGGFTDYTQVFGVPKQQFYPTQTTTAINKTSGMGALPWGTGVTGALELITGLSQAWKDRDKTPATFELDPNVATMQTEAMNRRNQGFTQPQRQAYEDKVYNDMISKYVQGRNLSGGQGSQAILSAIVGQNSQNRNNLALADAQLEQQNRGFANQINQFVQGQSNMKTEQERQDYYAKQQATAAAIKGGLQNLGSFADVASGNPLALLNLL